MVTTFKPRNQAIDHTNPTTQDFGMPFSSRTGKDVLSPILPKTAYNSAGTRSQDPEHSREGEDYSGSRRRMSVEKWFSDSSSRKQHRSPNRARVPGLNVVTNFSKSPLHTQRGAGPQSRNISSTVVEPVPAEPQVTILPNRSYSGPKKRDPRVPRENQDRLDEILQSQLDLKELGGLGFKRGHKTPNSTTETKGLVSDLKRKSNRRSELSPSDRVVAIGLAVTPTSIDERLSSPESRRSKGPGSYTRQYHKSQAYPLTPSIMVTPAKEEASWSATSSDQAASFQPRPASSIYSQATHRGRAVTQPSPIPPVPILPDASLYERLRKASEPLIRRDPGKSSARVMSTGTEFDDDDIGPGEPHSTDPERPQLRLLPRSSTDSICTRHRSQGWWNYITSPFSAKPSSPLFSSNDDNRRMAELDSPHSSDATKIGEELDEDTQDKKDGFSPPMRDSVRSEKTHTTIETDEGDSYIERVATSPTSYDALANNVAISHPRNISILHSPEMPLSPEGFGAAAEYYQACWHDQNSPTPYFECQNHTCLPFPDSRLTKRPTMFDIPGVPKDAGPHDFPASEHDVLKPNGFQQTPSNRFSAAFKEAVTPKARPTSEGTIIEDIDTTPQVEEAHVAPIVRAPAPIVAPQVLAGEPATGTDRGVDSPVKPQESQSPPENQRAIPTAQEVQIAQNTIQEPAPPTAYVEPVKHLAALRAPETPQPATSEPTFSTERRELTPPQHASPEPPSAVAPKEIALKSLATQIRSSPERDVAPDGIQPMNDHRPVQIINHYHGNIPPSRNLEEQYSLFGLYPPPREKSTLEENRERLLLKEHPSAKSLDAASDVKGKEEKKKQKSKRRGCVSCGTCLSHGKPQSKKKKWLLIALGVALVLLIILIIVLAMTLTRKGDKMAIQSQFLNLTGFPPIPTGISTIVDPDAAYEQSGCVSPTTMWSCSLPKEEQASVAPNDPDQPNFRVEIRFQNGTNVSLGTDAGLHQRSDGHAPNAVSAGRLIRSRLLRLRDTFSSALFAPSPAPPSLEDQSFLGKTTDNVSAPFDGEITPFFMSFESANRLSSRLVKRANGLTNSTNSTDPLPDLGSAIPTPDVNPDGTAAPANLLPFPSSQPLRLFDRGRPTEHYGFYTYFDRSIFLASTAILNTTTETAGNVPGDENGGAAETAATVRCTWTQTRFLVQIWTNLGNTGSLLTSSNSTASNSTTKNPQNLTESSADDFSRPGSFPYPISITLDRHGGDIKTKEIFCYGMDDRQRIIPDQKKLQLEDRAFQGQLVNPAAGPFGQVNVSTSEGGPGGIDGGTGGCGCIWRNWQGAQ